MENGKQPFAGIRVIDLTHVLAGPYATYQLAVFGAEVIKVEHPSEPDQTRLDGADRALGDSGMGTNFLVQNSNKLSISVDLKAPGGADIIRELVADADILVENYRPGAMDALGLGYEALAAINPRLIYASISAFGQDGPRGWQTAYDQVIQATSGLMAVNGTPDTAPVRLGTPAVDYSTGTMAAFALAAALFQRTHTGKGQHIDLAMLDVAFALMGPHITGHLRTGHRPKAVGNHNEFATVRQYATMDGQIQLAAINLRQQRRLWEALGLPELAKDDNHQRRADTAREVAVLQELMPARTADAWEAFFQAHHVPAARIRQIPEALADPHVGSRDIIGHLDDAPGLPGRVSVPVAPFRLRHGGGGLRSPPPRLGEHTDLILGQLGYLPADIDRLRQSEAIGRRPETKNKTEEKTS